MEIRKLLTDDDAVSPVIGVILMVAITVILAAVIGAFVLGFGGGGPSAPSVQWDTSVDSSGTNDIVLFEHGGGDTIDDPSTLQVTGAATADPVQMWDGSTLTGDATASDTLTTGSIVGVDTGGSASGEYNLVWSSPDSDSTQELATHNA